MCVAKITDKVRTVGGPMIFFVVARGRETLEMQSDGRRFPNEAYEG